METFQIPTGIKIKNKTKKKTQKKTESTILVQLFRWLQNTNANNRATLQCVLMCRQVSVQIVRARKCLVIVATMVRHDK